jgi:hypothetical protein
MIAAEMRTLRSNSYHSSERRSAQPEERLPRLRGAHRANRAWSSAFRGRAGNSAQGGASDEQDECAEDKVVPKADGAALLHRFLLDARGSRTIEPGVNSRRVDTWSVAESP